MGAAPDPLEAIELERADWMDPRLDAFRVHLRSIVSKTNARLAARLQKSLGITNGVIDSSPANLKILRTLDTRIEKEMDGAGFQNLLSAFVEQFPGQLQFIYAEIRQLNIILPGVLPSVRFKPDEFVSTQLNAVAAIDSTVEQAARAAGSRAMLSSAGLNFSELLESVAAKFDNAIPFTLSAGQTAMATYFRTAQGRAYDLIQRAMPGEDNEYKFFGPADVKTRDFCLHLLGVDESYTRARIDDMDNGQLPNPWLTCGGYNCRHRWRLYFDAAAIKAAA